MVFLRLYTAIERMLLSFRDKWEFQAGKQYDNQHDQNSIYWITKIIQKRYPADDGRFYDALIGIFNITDFDMRDNENRDLYYTFVYLYEDFFKNLSRMEGLIFKYKIRNRNGVNCWNSLV